MRANGHRSSSFEIHKRVRRMGCRGTDEPIESSQSAVIYSPHHIRATQVRLGVNTADPQPRGQRQQRGFRLRQLSRWPLPPTRPPPSRAVRLSPVAERVIPHPAGRAWEPANEGATEEGVHSTGDRRNRFSSSAHKRWPICPVALHSAMDRKRKKKKERGGGMGEARAEEVEGEHLSLFE